MDLPAQKCRTSKISRTRPRPLSERGHGCFISPRPADAECSAQERATQLRDFSQIAAGNPIFCVHQPPHQGITKACGETEKFILQGLASPWDTIPVNARDATKQRGAEGTLREASLSIKRVRKHNNATSKRKNPDSDSQAHTQPPQGHKGCTPERLERGRDIRHPHLRLIQPASKLWPYDP